MDSRQKVTSRSEQRKELFRIWKKIFSYLHLFRSAMYMMGFFMVCLSLADILYPQLVAYAIDTYVIPKRSDGFVNIGIMSLVLGIYASVLVFFFCKIGFQMEGLIAYKLREDLFSKIQRLSIGFFSKNPVGELLSRMGAATQKISNIVPWCVVDMSWGFSYIVFQIVAMLVINVKLAGIVLVTIPIVAFVTQRLNQKLLRLQRDVSITNTQLTGMIGDGIYGAKTSKTLCLEELNKEEFEQMSALMRRQSIAANNVDAIYHTVPVALSAIPMALLILVGGQMVKAGEITIGTVTIFITYSTMIYEPVSQFVSWIATLLKGQASAERIMSLINAHEDVVDSREVQEKYGSVEEHKIDNWEKIRGDIEFKNVGFAYEEGNDILKNFNLSVKKGQRIALVGRTGAGKSTIINLLCRFYEPTEGEILIDGIDYRQRSQNWLHSSLGYVLQTPFLFSGTIAQNIKYGSEEASREDIVEAAKIVSAHDFIMKLEHGYDTEVGESGSKLSGGQRQLISFARAVLRNPRIFILDEATSSVDTETEALIQEAVENVLGGRTSFVVAHRLSTVRNADLILVIDNGKIIEQGSHSELIGKKGRYYAMYTNQLYEMACSSPS